MINLDLRVKPLPRQNGDALRRNYESHRIVRTKRTPLWPRTQCPIRGTGATRTEHTFGCQWPRPDACRLKQKY